MKIGKTPTILAWSPEKKVEAVKVDPAIHAGLEKCLQNNPSRVRLGGPPGGVGANAGLSLGAPVAVAQNVEFLRLFDPNVATDLVVAASEAVEAPSPSQMINVADKAKAFVEQLPELPPEAEIGFKIYGLLRTGSDFASALKEPGAASKVERNLALLHVVVAFCELGTTLPTPKRVQSGLRCLSWVLQKGEEIFIVGHPEQVEDVVPSADSEPRL
jgi:hypothetical protein